MSENPVFEVDDAIVLLLGSAAGGQTHEIRGITRLEKLVFLLDKEAGVSDAMTEDPEFEGYNFGPFSRKVYQAVEMLEKAGLVEDSVLSSRSTDDTWESEKVIGSDGGRSEYTTRNVRLTELGLEYLEALKSELGEDVVNSVATLGARFADWSLRPLVRYVYEKYPQYTERSLIRDEVLGKRGDPS